MTAIETTIQPVAQHIDSLPTHSREEEVPLDVDPDAPAEITIFSLLEHILKRHRVLETVIRVEDRQPALIPQFLAIALGGFALYGITMGLMLGVSGWTPQLNSLRSVMEIGIPLIEFHSTAFEGGDWWSGTAVRLTIAYCVGLVAATGVCLPSLYFYGLLSGIRLTMRDVVIHSLKSKATAAVALAGLLPVYFVIYLTTVVFELSPHVVHMVQWLGFAFPFLGGLWGTQSLYRGFLTLSNTLPTRLNSEECDQRSCFLGRLVLAWSVCYSVVSPIMVFTIWQKLQ